MYQFINNTGYSCLTLRQLTTAVAIIAGSFSTIKR